MPDFYESISAYYDLIFPYKPVQKAFVEKRLRGKSYEDLQLLDIGCATGSLAVQLAHEGIGVTAIDLDERMIEGASRSKDPKAPLTFKAMNMLSLKDHFKCNHFDMVTCFGNTIVHLSTIRQIEFFLKQIAVVLKPGAPFALQLIHYDRIIDEGIDHLPTIENDSIRFERIYAYKTGNKKLRFITRLEHKESGTIIQNEIDLYALRKEELEGLMKKSYFTNLRFYGGFDESPFTKDSVPLVISATKMQ